MDDFEQLEAVVKGAEALRKTYEALVASGFTETQAIYLVGCLLQGVAKPG